MKTIQYHVIHLDFSKVFDLSLFVWGDFTSTSCPVHDRVALLADYMPVEDLASFDAVITVTSMFGIDPGEYLWLHRAAAILGYSLHHEGWVKASGQPSGPLWLQEVDAITNVKDLEFRIAQYDKLKRRQL